jgi:hypothetical protein
VITHYGEPTATGLLLIVRCARCHERHLCRPAVQQILPCGLIALVRSTEERHHYGAATA